jgi:hypothetical protein
VKLHHYDQMMGYLTRRQKFSNGGDAILPQPNPLSPQERNQKVFNDYVGRMKKYLSSGVNMPEWFVKDLVTKKAEELGVELKADGGRIHLAKAGLADPANNIVKGQDLGTGIQQRLKDGKNIKYITSAVEDTILHEHKSYKDAKDFRETLIEKYKIGDPKAYKGKYNYKELIKDKDFEKFWKAKVDGRDADTILQGMGTREAIQKVIKKYNLKPNDYEGIFNKVVEETRITEGIRKGRTRPGQKKLISDAIIGNLLKTFKESYKPTVGTIDTKTMGKLLKLRDGELEKLMTFIDKSIPAETAHLMDSDVVSRTDKAAVVKKMLNDAGITFEKHGRGEIGSRWRFGLDKDSKKFKNLEKSKTFGFVTEKPVRKYPINYKDKFTAISRKSPEYLEMGYDKDSGAIRQLTKSLNNAVNGMSDTQLRAFVNDNPKIKNLVTLRFDPSSPNLFINTPLKDMTISQIRQNLQFEKDHIRGRSTVKYDGATKKILDGLNIEYPKNLYLINKALNMSTKQRVENFVANYPNEAEKIKKIDKYFKDNKISYYNRSTGTYGGAKPSKSAVELRHLGITKASQLHKLLSGTYKDKRGNIKPIVKNVNKLIITLNEQNKARGGVSLIDDMAIIQKEGRARGWKLNSFAGVLDFTDSMKAAGIKLPPAVTQAASRIIDMGGATLRGVGKVALVLDPIFMGFDEARAKRRGAGELDTLKYMGDAFVEGLVNLPTVAAGAAKWTKDKLTGEGKKAGPFDYLPTKPEFKSDILYTPQTFAQENLEKNLKDTSMDERVKNVESDMHSAARYKEPLIANPEYQEILESISREDIEKKIRKDDELSPYKNIEKEAEIEKPEKFGIYADQIKNLEV